MARQTVRTIVPTLDPRTSSFSAGFRATPIAQLPRSRPRLRQNPLARPLVSWVAPSRAFTTPPADHHALARDIRNAHRPCPSCCEPCPTTFALGQVAAFLDSVPDPGCTGADRPSPPMVDPRRFQPGVNHAGRPEGSAASADRNPRLWRHGAFQQFHQDLRPCRRNASLPDRALPIPFLLLVQLHSSRPDSAANPLTAAELDLLPDPQSKARLCQARVDPSFSALARRPLPAKTPATSCATRTVSRAGLAAHRRS